VDIATRRKVRYDTVDLRALKSWRDGQLNLSHGTNDSIIYVH